MSNLLSSDVDPISGHSRDRTNNLFLHQARFPPNPAELLSGLFGQVAQPLDFQF